MPRFLEQLVTVTEYRGPENFYIEYRPNGSINVQIREGVFEERNGRRRTKVRNDRSIVFDITNANDQTTFARYRPSTGELLAGEYTYNDLERILYSLYRAKIAEQETPPEL